MTYRANNPTKGTDVYISNQTRGEILGVTIGQARYLISEHRTAWRDTRTTRLIDIQKI